MKVTLSGMLLLLKQSEGRKCRQKNEVDNGRTIPEKELE